MQELNSQGLEIENLDDASDLLATSVIHRKSSVIICISVPRLLPTIYQRTIIEPLPRQNITTKLSYHEVFKNSEQILAIKSPCKETNQVTLCERRQLVDISDHPCEASLLKGQPGQCPMSEKPPAIEIRTISPGTLLVVAVHQDVNINSTCGVSNRTLTGIHMVTFHNCSLLVNNELYENFELWFNQPIINPIVPGQIQTSVIERNFNATELRELHLENRKHMEAIDLKYRLGFVSLSSFFIIALALLALVIIKYQVFTKTGNCSGRSMLKGGRVKHRTSPASTIAEESNNITYVEPTCTDTQTPESAVPETDIARNAEESNVIMSVDGGTCETSLLGARLALLGKKAGQLGL